MTNTCFYSTWQGASNAAQRLGFKSYLEYLAGYKQDSQLPCDPAKQYYRNWKNNGGWYGFLDKKILQIFILIGRMLAMRHNFCI